MLWYSLEAPHWGASNEYHNVCFHLRNKKIIFLIPPHILRYVYIENLEQTVDSHAMKFWHSMFTYHHPKIFFRNLDSSGFNLYLANSADDKLVIFFLFFPGNRIWFKQNVFIWDNLHEMSDPVFWGKIRKIYQNIVCWKFTQSAKR